MTMSGLDRTKETAAAEICLTTMHHIVAETASLSKAAASCATDGNVSSGLQIALDIEPLLAEANTLLQAASILNRRARSG
jgi:hypothetical protein